ncbi:MAG: hypothetical protein WD266_07315 [Balneolales bacterium]
MAALTVYTLDKKVVDLNKVDAIGDYFYKEGFEILLKHRLTGSQKAAYSRLLVSKGWQSDIKEPGAMVIALDLNPIKPSNVVLEYYPQLDNARIFYKDRVKDIIRVNRTPVSKPVFLSGRIISNFTRKYCSLRERLLVQHERQDLVDASLNTDEAWEYLHRILPSRITEIKNKISKLSRGYQAPFPVKRRIYGQDRNAKIEIVAYRGGEAICKTFKPGREDIFNRELQGLKLSGKINEIPRLFEYGENWILMAYHERKLRLQNFALIPMKYVNKIFDALEKIYDEGYAHMDFHIGNIILTKSGDVKIIDFEDLHQYKEKPASFKESYDIAGITNRDDMPLEPPRTYQYWYPLIGLKFDSIYNDHFIIQHLKRSLYMVRILADTYITGPVKAVKAWLKVIIAGYRIKLNNKIHPRKSIHPFNIIPWNQPRHKKKFPAIRRKVL